VTSAIVFQDVDGMFVNNHHLIFFVPVHISGGHADDLPVGGQKGPVIAQGASGILPGTDFRLLGILLLGKDKFRLTVKGFQIDFRGRHIQFRDHGAGFGSLFGKGQGGFFPFDRHHGHVKTYAAAELGHAAEKNIINPKACADEFCFGFIQGALGDGGGLGLRQGPVNGFPVQNLDLSRV